MRSRLMLFAALAAAASADGYEWGKTPTDEDKKVCEQKRLDAPLDMKFNLKNCYKIREWIAASKLVELEKAEPAPEGFDGYYLNKGEETLAAALLMREIQKK